MSLLVTLNRFASAVFASTQGGPDARPEPAEHFPAPGNSPDSRSCSANSVDWLPCSTYGIAFSNSTSGVGDYVDPDEIIPYSAGTCACVAASSFTSTDRGSMMPELSSEKNRNCKEEN